MTSPSNIDSMTRPSTNASAAPTSEPAAVMPSARLLIARITCQRPAQVAEDRIAMLGITNDNRHELLGEPHDCSNIDSRPRAMLLRDSWVARIALRPAEVTVK